MTYTLDIITVVFIKFLNSQPGKRLNLPTNGEVYVTNDVEYRDKCTVDRIYVNSDNVLRLKENDLIFLDYGKIELVVKKVGKRCRVPDATRCLRSANCSVRDVVRVSRFFFFLTRIFRRSFLRRAVSDKTRRAVGILQSGAHTGCSHRHIGVRQTAREKHKSRHPAQSRHHVGSRSPRRGVFQHHQKFGR